MGELKNQMLRLMELKNFSPKTIQCYMMYMIDYVGYYKKSPDKMGEEEILNYLCYLKDEKLASWSAINIAYSALRLFYESILGRKWDVKRIPRPKIAKMLPQVLSKQEVMNLFKSTWNRKHRIALMTTYSAGLRISETTHLKVSDIDSESMQIRVVKGKGNKDRITLLSNKLLEELREYYKREKPEEWLFPSKDKNKPLNPSTLQKAFNEAKKKRILQRRLRYIRYGTVLPHTCLRAERIYSQSRNCSVTAA